MTPTSHKTIWRITVAFVVFAGVVALLRGEQAEAPYESPTVDEAIALRDTQITELHRLLESDWRMRRLPTRRAVEQVSAYAQHPTLANAEAHYALALFRYYHDFDAEGALNALVQVIELRPDWSWPYALRGVILYREGNTVDGQKSLHRAMELDPQWSRPYSDLAILHRLDQQWDIALEYAQTAIDMDPDNPIPYFNYGVIVDYQGDHKKAQTYYQRVLEMNAELPAPYYNIACGFARQGKIEESLQYLDIAIRLDPAFHSEVFDDVDFDRIRNTDSFIKFMNDRAP